MPLARKRSASPSSTAPSSTAPSPAGLLLVGLLLAGCAAIDSVAVSTTSTASIITTTEALPSSPPPAEPASSTCTVGPVPVSAGLDPFYAQGCDLDGFWVIAADVVDPEAIETAAAVVTAFFQHDPAFAAALRSTDVRLGVIGANQRTTEMPEWRDLYEVFPDVDWDKRARGLGATDERPLVAVGEENVRCLAGDRYVGEDILLHEFAHVIDAYGYARTDDLFTAQLGEAFVTATNEGTWADTYAASNIAEYWAEAVQSYFGRNLGHEVPDAIHGPIDTRAELAEADPAITALIDRTIGGVELPDYCY